MAFGDRPDGVLLRKLPGFRRVFPHLMPTRTESAIYYRQRVRVRGTLDWLERFNAGREHKISVFTVVLAAGVRTLALRPDANRFVAGRRIYQRRTIDLSFVVKRELTERSGETNVKLTFEPRDTIAAVAERVRVAVEAVRSRPTSADEQTTDRLLRLPRSLVRFVMWAVRALDYFGLLPASFIRGDALYASAFLANLGSLGLDTVTHHLFEWGTVPFFLVVGKVKQEPAVNERGELEVADVMDLSCSLDERITDGVHYARTIELLTRLVENPALLESPPDELPDPFALA